MKNSMDIDVYMCPHAELKDLREVKRSAALNVKMVAPQ